ncbi:MAG: glycosyltransferase family 4 protein, partial [Cyanobacteria bacterium P01_H01_bin.15]
KSLYAPSRFLAEFTSERFGRSVDVLHTPIFFPTDIDTFEQPDHIPKPYVLFFGKMTVKKGILVLARAMREFLKTRPDWHFVAIGQNSEAPDGRSMLHHVKTILQDYLDRVLCIDALPHDRLLPIIKDSEFVAIPSLADNLPNALIESLYFKKRVVATTGSCFEDHLADPPAGILVKPNDALELTDALFTMAEMDELTIAKMERAAEIQSNRLSPEAIVPNLEKAFHAHIMRTRNLEETK